MTTQATPSPTVLPTPMASVSISYNSPNPEPTGSTFKVTAVGSGGTTPYQFKYVAVTGGERHTIRDWSQPSPGRRRSRVFTTS